MLRVAFGKRALTIHLVGKIESINPAATDMPDVSGSSNDGIGTFPGKSVHGQTSL